MSKITFENAALAECIKKADRVAPSRGSSFDKAAGIVIEASEDSVCVRATDLTIYYTEWITADFFEGDPIQWRLPSKLFAQIVGSLPIGSGKTCTLENQDGKIMLISGRIKAKIPLLDIDYFPTWQPFDTEALVGTSDVGGRLEMVEWAAAKDNQPPWAGVLLDGTHALACDKYRLARVPLSVPHLESPIIVPSNLLSGLIRQTGEVQMFAEGTNMMLMPDEHTQITTVLFDGQYPSLSKLLDTEYPLAITLKKAQLLEIANRVRGVVQSDRMAALSFIIGREEVVVMMSDAEAALMDAIEVPGQATHERVTIKFAPNNLIEAVDKVPSDQVRIDYDPEHLMKVVHIDGGSGYEAWIAVRKD
jgi:DNA polymerase III sliding clamp (beta) subunit (PCNA family)